MGRSSKSVEAQRAAGTLRAGRAPTDDALRFPIQGGCYHGLRSYMDAGGTVADLSRDTHLIARRLYSFIRGDAELSNSELERLARGLRLALVPEEWVQWPADPADGGLPADPGADPPSEGDDVPPTT